MGILEGFWVYRVDATNIGITTGSAMVNGELRRATSAKTDLTYGTISDGHWVDVWILADSAASTVTYSAVDTNASTPGGSSNPGTNGLLIGSIRFNTTGDINATINYRNNLIVGWDWQVGDDTASINRTITFGKTFNALPSVWIAVGGYRATASSDPTDLSVFTTNVGAAYAASVPDVTTTSCLALLNVEGGNTLGSANNFAFMWAAHGSY